MEEQTEPVIDALAFFEAREDFQKAKAELQEYRARENPPTAPRISIEEYVDTLDEQQPFDIAAGITEFLEELGLWSDQEESASSLRAEEAAQDSRVAWNESISQEDLALLVSVVPASKLQHLELELPRSSSVGDSESQYKARLLDTVARLALEPAFTLPIARIFSKILLDLAGRWLIMLGYDGRAYATGGADKKMLVQTLAALARLSKFCPALYPVLLIVLQHPHMQTNSPFTLLSNLPEGFTPPFVPSSALDPSASPSPTIYHPDLPALLMTLHALVEVVPHLPLIPTILKHYGGPIPPLLLYDVMSSHPLASMRILSWQIISLWLGWTGPRKEDLRSQYVYNSDQDSENGKNGTLQQTVPIPDLSKPKGEGEEWLEYWPRVSGYAKLSGGRLQLQMEAPYLDCWIYESETRKLEKQAWKSIRVEETGASIMEIDGVEPKKLCFDREDASPFLACVQGIYTIRESCLPDSSSNLPSATTSTLPHPQIDTIAVSNTVFVPTAPAVRTLRQLALYSMARAPVLLSSPSSAGKAAILEELHRNLHAFPGRQASRDRQIVTINLADRSLDAKTLLGSLSSSPTEPGTFVFVEGSLTRSIRHGRWLVLEDIDKAADDVLCTIAELVERIKRRVEGFVGGGWGGATQNGVGVLAGGRWVEAAEGFMLFATRSVQSTSTEDNTVIRQPTFIGNQYWTNVWMDMPTLDETREIVTGRFPRLSQQIVAQLVQVWDNVKQVANGTTGSSGTGMSRDVGIRDLVKWCDRVQRALPRDIAITSLEQNPIFQEEVFVEARDVFLGSFPATLSTEKQTSSKYLAIVASLQEGLSLNAERVEWMLNGRTPEILASSDADIAGTTRIGRARLQKIARKRAVSEQQKTYALTKPFLVLLERLAVCAQLAEPVLMVGETGTGKTAAVGHLADRLGRNLVALNLSNQTEASDLLGGFKPVNEAEELERIALDLVNQFVELFSRTFSLARNADFTAAVTKAFKKKKWLRLVGLWREAARMASDRIVALKASTENVEDSPRKKRKTSTNDLASTWHAFLSDVASFEQRQSSQDAKAAKFAFAFVEGPLVKAIQRGDWVLLDEVNLATPETLESLSTLLQASDASLVLTERGDLEPVQRHPDFRLFACMNPATDIGKRDLPPALRSKFTEIYVLPPDSDREALLSIVQGYIGHVAVGDRGIVFDVAEFYLAIKALAAAGTLADGTNQPPHFSMRTLARALTFASDLTPSLGIRRAAYEGCVMTFTTLLESKSSDIVLELMHKHFVERARNPRSFLSALPVKPLSPSNYVNLSSFWLAKGPASIESSYDYVLTPSVQLKLVNLARAVAARRFPVLIQGPTSSGKTSIIEYLAHLTGHRFVRINNHEHTDIQEYLGTYVSDPQTGLLVFREGILVKAVRNGDWIVLDELNLAPTDVLEALNRLLDDNRELVIPETQEVVKPHPHFMLFATQNPPGLYGGRKVLSRAFRNRFMEMHFSDVPKDELERILCERCRIAPSYAKKIVAVFLELQKRRQSTRVFEEKQAFVTLRDLFRWGGREAVGYEQLAADGYMLLAERARKPEDKLIVKEVIESIMKVKLDEGDLYGNGFQILTKDVTLPSDLVWTTAMRRLFVLVRAALQHGEPVLLVGETGSGKTSVCQSIADSLGTALHVVNCHQNTETSDLIGSQRPIRNRAASQEALRAEALVLLSKAGIGLDEMADYEEVTAKVQLLSRTLPIAAELLGRMQKASALFTWHDGPLLQAMKSGDHLLLDEISLADDSVLERLNSVLESGRTLVVAEKGAEDLEDVTLVAHDRFKVLATMNPGGDYGKKELSPALRNRFTEIWVPWVTDHQDLVDIIKGRWQSEALYSFTDKLLEFGAWFTSAVRPREAVSFGTIVTLRDVLAWVAFMNAFPGDAREGFVHGALMTLVDAIGSTSATSGLSQSSASTLRQESVKHLLQLARPDQAGESFTSRPSSFSSTETDISIYPFSLARGAAASSSVHDFSLLAPTTLENARKVLRAMQLAKPILLEGSPGVGKTSLVTALAGLAGYNLSRINLSDQTDLIDLFGSDLPVEGGRSGEFAWRDAPFLAAMQAGDWVLLDEMNLASQSVLEGLNSCLDHRGSVYIPELDRSFSRHPDFRIFAAQNPSSQGGSRKGLPRSFVDRFTQVYMTALRQDDYNIICNSIYPDFPTELTGRMVSFVTQVDLKSSTTSRFAQQGAPWEVNLRDILRWFQLLRWPTGLERDPDHPAEYLDSLFLQRFRTEFDREQVATLYQEVFSRPVVVDRPGHPITTSRVARIGATKIHRKDTLHFISDSAVPAYNQYQLRPLQALSTALHANILAIITGPQGSGKSTLVQAYAALAGQRIRSFHMNPQTDTLEMLGTFEQASQARAQSTSIHLLEDRLAQLVDGAISTSDWKTLYTTYQELGRLKTMCNNGSAPSDLRNQVAYLTSTVGSSGFPEDVLALLQALQSSFAENATVGRFEWVDGPLVQAMQNGDIFVIENANLCSASVLDRLNALFETHGKLHLTERGMVKSAIVTVDAHPAFRVVMMLDPKYGELSRAMRNRGVEIALPRSSTAMQHRLCATTTCPLWLDSPALLADASVTRDTQSSNAPVVLTSTDIAVLDHAILSSAGSGLSTLARQSRSKTIVDMQQQPLVAKEYNSRTASAQRATVQLEVVTPLLFSLDTNDARRTQPTELREILLALDTAIKPLLAGLRASQETEGMLQRAVTKPNNQLTVGERSCISISFPSKLPNLEDGILQVFPLQQTLSACILQSAFRYRLNTEGAASHDVNFLVELEALNYELSHIAKQQHLEYATYQTVLSWIGKSLDGSNESDVYFDNLHKALQQAQSSIKLTSGLYFEQIWKHCLRDTRIPKHLMSRVDAAQAAASLCTVAQLPEDLVKLYYEVVSELGTNGHMLNDTSEMSQVLKRLDAKLSSYAKSGPSEDTGHLNAHMLLSLAELQAVAESVAPSTSARRLLRKISKWSDRPVQSLAAISTLPSSASAGVQVLMPWLRHLCFPTSGTAPIQVADLLNSSLLKDVQELSLLGSNTPLSAYATVTQQLVLASQAHYELAAASTSTFTRVSGLTTALVLLVSELFNAVSVPNSLRDVAEPTVSTLLDRLLVDTGLRDVVGPMMQAPLETLRDADVAVPDYTSALANAYLNYSQLFWSLFLPNIPLDPAVASQAKRAFLTRRKDRLHAWSSVQAEANSRVGGSGAIELDLLVCQLVDIDRELASVDGVDFHRDGSQAILSALFLELHQAASTLFNNTQLMTSIQQSITKSGNILAKLQNLKDALASVVARVSSAYPGYRDIVEPLMLCFGALDIGLELHIHQRRVAQAGLDGAKHGRALSAICSYPSVASAERLAKIDLPVSLRPERPSTISPSILARLRLQALCYLAHSTASFRVTRVHDGPLLERVQQCYEQLFQFWAIDQKRAEEAKIDAESIYRSRKQEILIPSDDDLEAAELAELFPVDDHEKELPGKPASAPAGSSGRLLGDDDITSVLDAHLSLFGSQEGRETSAQTAQTKGAAVQRILRAYPAQLSESVDYESTIYRLDALTALAARKSVADERFDFYLDSNPSEVRKMAPAVISMQVRVRQLIEAWPEQMILVEIDERCEALLSIPVSTPVARVLTYLESFLPKIEDWERYASKETSLRENQSKLVELIIHWRRLELHSWARLLESQERKFCLPLADWWFRFYETTVRATASFGEQTSQEDLSEFLNKVVELLESFFTSSPVGQFNSRLDLVFSFAKLTSVVASNSGYISLRISAILSNVYEFYKRKGQEIISHVANERKKLEKDVHDIVRLASWKDVNIDALKQSAQKSHRQLYKIVRKLRKLLDKPASDFLSTSANPSSQVGSGEQVVIQSSSGAPALAVPLSLEGLPADTPNAVQHLDQTVKRLQSILTARYAAEQSSSAQAVEQLSSIIITRSESLRTEAPKGTTKEEQAKSLGGLTSRKRKAWSDLLKELKRIGLSPRPAPTILARQHDSSLLYETAPLHIPGQHPDRKIVDSVNAYFYNIIARLPTLRQTPSNHHDDISSSQFQVVVGSIQSGFAMVVEDRRRLDAMLKQQNSLMERLDGMADIIASTMADQQHPQAGDYVRDHLVQLYRARTVLQEASSTAERHTSLMSDEEDRISARKYISIIRESETGMSLIIEQLEVVGNSASTTGLLTSAVAGTLVQARLHLDLVTEMMTRLEHDFPRLAYLCRPVLQWLSTEATVLPDWSAPSQAPLTDGLAVAEHTKVIGSILVVVQDVQSDAGDISILGEEDELVEAGLSREFTGIRERSARFRVQEIGERLDKFYRALRPVAPQMATQLLSRVSPILQAYLSMLDLHVTAYLAWHRSLLKFCHILVGLVLVLAQEGFCKPAEGESKAGGETQNGQGTGMGAGKGDKNVSKEIEGEEQVEGLQDEVDQDEQENGDEEQDNKDDAVDMSNDFGGRTEDVPEDDDDEENDKEEDEEGEDEDVDEELGKVDPLDPNAVDDKFWGGDDKDEKEPEETEEQTQQQPQQDGDTEMGERQEDAGKKDDKKQPDQPDQPDQEDGKDAEEAGDAEKNEEVKEDQEIPDDQEGNGEQAEEQERQEMPDLDSEAQALDLPEDLQLDTQPKEDDGELDDDLDMDGELEGPEDNKEDDPEDASDKEAEGSDQAETAGQPEESETAEQLNPESEEAMQHTSGMDSGAAGGESASSSALQPEEAQERKDANEQSAGDADMTASAGQPGSEEAGASGRRERARRQETGPSGKSEPAPQDGGEEQEEVQAEDDKLQDSTQQAEGEKESAEESGEKKRDLGDSAKAWMRRLESIPDAQDPGPGEDDQNAAESKDVEYTQEAAEELEMQAAGAADEEQAQQAGQRSEETMMVDDFQALEVDEIAQATEHNEMQIHHIPDATTQLEDEDQVMGAEVGPDAEVRCLEDIDEIGDRPVRNPSPDVEEQEGDLAQQLQHWYEAGRSSLPSDEVWRLYESLTRDLSFSLTESLRLILEPTLATRLKGDYRTGKRLNMKKIIPYIASDFTKDKIWLRRTRPSQREYQILLAVDDSRSMSDSQSVHLAYQTLALVCQSLTRLEAGEVSVCRFGETVDFIHNFEDGPVSESSGTKIVDSFTFSQRSTDVRRLLEKSLQRLAAARDNRRSSSADLWQLEIIISDGICQDLEDLRALLRKAAEQKVMVVFVVVDSLHQQQTNGTSAGANANNRNSILSMNSVSYVRGKDGALELKMERYLDSFPFDYYVVLRNVEALPDVLSQTLRQFFERVAGDG